MRFDGAKNCGTQNDNYTNNFVLCHPHVVHSAVRERSLTLPPIVSGPETGAMITDGINSEFRKSNTWWLANALEDCISMRNFYHFFPANLIRNIHFHRSSKSFFISSEQKNIFNCKQYKKTYLYYISMYNRFWHIDWSVLICFNKIIEIPSSHDLSLKISVFTKVYFASHDVSGAHSWKPQGVDWKTVSIIFGANRVAVAPASLSTVFLVIINVRAKNVK